MNKNRKKIFIFLLLALAITALVFIMPSNNTIELKSLSKEENHEQGSIVTLASGTDLIPNSKTSADLATNRANLQAAIDKVSKSGGGTVNIPEGTFYFSAYVSRSDSVTSYKIDYDNDGIAETTKSNEDFVILCRNNVKIVGAGESKTILKPYCISGKSKSGVNMFYYNKYTDSNFSDPTYLVNADFKDFTINEDETGSIDSYTSSGKGFMINLFKDCDWENVTVKNSMGTGFGMDCPLNCTIKNCTAINCGRGVTSVNSPGGSGFGIGTGFTDGETMIISNCTASGNGKFGFFFEHQGRFQLGSSIYPSTGKSEYVVQNCTASNNMYDFGGIRANDVTFENCKSTTVNNSKTTPLQFEKSCVRVHLVNCSISQKFTAVTDSSSYYYNPVYWATKTGITNGTNSLTFGQGSTCSRITALTFLYRLAERPGTIQSNGDSLLTQYYKDQLKNFTDITDYSNADAILWAINNGITNGTTPTTFEPNAICKRCDFIVFLWRYAGEPSSSTKHNFSDVGSGVYYEKALNWAIEKGIVSGTDVNFYPTDSLKREAAVTFLYRYATGSNKFNITYNLLGGTVSNANPSTYTAGTSTFTLNNPTRAGYTFKGWTGDNSSTPSTTAKITAADRGNKTYTANWIENTTYKVVHQQMDIDGKTYITKDTETLNGVVGNSVTPSVKNYSGFTAPSTQTVTIKENGETTVTYKYTRNKYTFTLESNAAVATDGSTVTGSYYYGQTITLNASASAGYTFKQWTSSNTSLVSTITEANTTFTMPIGNVTMTPQATINAYTISYTLNGGTVSTANPTEYTIETEKITLNNPTKSGHTFLGWTGSNGSTPQVNVSIEKGSIGNKSYTANWQKDIETTQYTVEHYKENLSGEYEVVSADTQVLDGVVGSSVTPSVKNYTGFTSPETQTVTIKSDSGTVVQYRYSRNEYTVSITAGTGIDNTSGAGTYKYGQSVSLNATLKSGYENITWSGDQTSASFTMPAKNIVVSVTASPIKYTITYNLDERNCFYRKPN